MRTYRIIISIFFSLLLIACDKDDQLSQTQLNEIVLAGSESKIWLIASSTVDGAESLHPCLMDDYWTFTRGKQIARENQTTSCPNGIPNNQTSSWSFENDGHSLTFFDKTYEVISLTEDQMKLESSSGGKAQVDSFVKK